MNLLLDSHAFIWMRQEPHRIGVMAISEMMLVSSRLFLSSATLWELQIKIDLGKFDFGDPLSVVIADEFRENSIELLPIENKHIFNLSNLPIHHRDPFDRMLISQAMVEEMTVVTVDPKFSEYGVKVLW